MKPWMTLPLLTSELVVWDRPERPDGRSVLLWDHDDDLPSLLDLAEDHREEICSRILGCFETLQEELSIVDSEHSRHSPSQTRLLRSSAASRRNSWLLMNFQSLVRLAALDMLLDNSKVTTLRYEGDDSKTELLVSACAKHRHVVFVAPKNRLAKQSLTELGSLRECLRSSAIVRLFVFCARRRRLSALRPSGVIKSDVILFSPLAHFDVPSLETGTLKSNY